MTLDYITAQGRLSPGLRRRVSLVVIVVLVNYCVFGLGVFLNSFGGWIDQLGAELCRHTRTTGNILVIIAIFYSLARRFVLSVRDWDFYGPSLAIIGYLMMHVLLRERPWWLPVIPGAN